MESGLMMVGWSCASLAGVTLECLFLVVQVLKVLSLHKPPAKVVLFLVPHVALLPSHFQVCGNPLRCVAQCQSRPSG